MMNKSLRDSLRESSSKTFYGFREMGCVSFMPIARVPEYQHKKEPPFPAALKLITGRRQTEWTGATRCPNGDSHGYKAESLINRKLTDFFRLR
jgi:hypothetical protein